MPISEWDQENIDAIISGHGDWFTAQLLRLINKADQVNRYKLAIIYPDEVAAYEKWRSSEQ